MDRKQKVLLIDKAPDRKERISRLKEHGFAVYPALRMEEARSRCKPGAYDVIVVNAGDELVPAQEFCDAIREGMPKQHVLLASTESDANGEYKVSADPQQLLERITRLLQPGSADDYASAA